MSEICVTGINDMPILESFIIKWIGAYSKYNGGDDILDIHFNNIKIKSTPYFTQSEERKNEKEIPELEKVEYFENRGDSVMVAQTRADTFESEYSTSINIQDTKGFSGSIKIPVFNLEPTINFSNNQTTTNTTKRKHTVQIPSQTVSIKPKCKRKVKYSVYRQQATIKSAITFSVDSSSTFDVIYRHYPTFQPTPIYSLELLKRHVTINLLHFLGELASKQNVFHGSKNIEYNCNTNKLLLKHVVTRNACTDICKLTFGPDRPIH